MTPPRHRVMPWRLLLLLPAAVALVLGVLAGLGRLGWAAGAPASAVVLHGPLMVSGFLGTLIALERAVALGDKWAFAAPGLSGAAAATWLAGVPPRVGGALAVGAAVLLLAVSVRIFLRQRAAFTATLAAGAACWAVGNALWLAGRTVPDTVQWWLLFLVLTIAGERLELSRLSARRGAHQAWFAAWVFLLVVGAAALSLDSHLGALVFGAGLVGLAGWLVRHDIARRTLRGRGLPRYAAVALLSGYVWLASGGVFWATPLRDAPLGYDATLHAVLLGFVMSMVFAHAPIILPAVGRIRVRYSPVLYVPLALLHASLAARIAGDLALDSVWRRWGGMGNAVALATFAAAMVASRTRRRPARLGHSYEVNVPPFSRASSARKS